MTSCPTCGRVVKARWRYCRWCGAELPPLSGAAGKPEAGQGSPTQAPGLGAPEAGGPGGSATGPLPGDGFPGLIVGALAFLLVVAVLVGLILVVLAPEMTKSKPPGQLQGPANAILRLLFLATLLAAIPSGWVGARLARRSGAPTTWATRVYGTAGPMVATGLLVIAAVRFGDGNWRTLSMTALLALLGALGGAFWGSRRTGTARRKARPPIATASMLAVGLLFLPFPPASHSVTKTIRTFAPAPNPLDIPAEDCVVQSNEGEGSIHLTIFSVQVGPNFSFQQEGSADKAWAVTIKKGVKIGLKGALGEHANAGPLKEGVSLEGEANLTITGADEYKPVPESQTNAVVGYGLIQFVAQIGGIFGLESQLLDPLIKRQVFDGSFPKIDKQDFSIGGEVKVTAEAEPFGKASLSLKSAAGVKRPTDTPEEFTVYISLKGTKSGDVLGYKVSALNQANRAIGLITGGVAGDLSGDAVLSITLKKTSVGPYHLLQPTKMSIEATGAFSGTLSGDVPKGSLKGISQWITHAKNTKLLKSLGADVHLDKSLQMEASIDFEKHPADLASLVAFLVDLYGNVGPSHIPGSESRLIPDAIDLASRLNKDADITLRHYSAVGVDANFDLLLGDGVSFGFGAEGGYTRQTLDIPNGASYRDPTKGPLGSFVSSATCVSSG